VKKRASQRKRGRQTFGGGEESETCEVYEVDSSQCPGDSCHQHPTKKYGSGTKLDTSAPWCLVTFQVNSRSPNCNIVLGSFSPAENFRLHLPGEISNWTYHFWNGVVTGTSGSCNPPFRRRYERRYCCGKRIETVIKTYKTDSEHKDL